MRELIHRAAAAIRALLGRIGAWWTADDGEDIPIEGDEDDGHRLRVRL